jgi:hypothetical protein
MNRCHKDFLVELKLLPVKDDIKKIRGNQDNGWRFNDFRGGGSSKDLNLIDCQVLGSVAIRWFLMGVSTVRNLLMSKD